MLKKLIQTNNDITSPIVRIALGVVILPHGLQKLLGFFGGFGFSATLAYFESVGLPWAVGFLVIVAESLGAVGLIVGFCSRIAALGISLVMLGAILLVHLQHGFFANWFGIQQGEGIEYFLLALGLGITIMIVGSGRWSVDSVLSDRLESSIQ